MKYSMCAKKKNFNYSIKNIPTVEFKPRTYFISIFLDI